ncbi:MAG: sulfite exporter TauE/SafE family protein [Lachnospiraceae bacterium]|nr:sulfite exporter TauE/SafE family protein [Lachnospiraceae bacterium]
MDDKKRKKQKGRLKRLLVLFGIFAAGVLGTFVLKDEFIVLLGGSLVFKGIGGVRALRMIRTVCIAGAALTGIGGGVFGVTTISRLQDQEAIEQKRNAFVAENRRKQIANLSVKDKLENSLLRDMLKEKLANGWNVLVEPIGQCVGQLEQMDSYQERLSRLLATNDVHTLSDTEEVLDRVEQYICKNVRKVLNYMEVADPNSAEDVELLRTKFAACYGDNQEQLKQTQEFIFALTDFINQQGDSDNDLSMLEVYKNTILESIKE